MPNRAAVVVLTSEEQKTLESLASSRTAPYRQVQRARLVLLAAQGHSNTRIAQEVDLSRPMVTQWQQRFIRDRLEGLRDHPRPGRPRVYSEQDRLRVVETACNQQPPDETHWSVRTLAKATGVGRDTVHTILREHRLKPHRTGTFSRSPDPDFVAKVVDVVGLYLPAGRQAWTRPRTQWCCVWTRRPKSRPSIGRSRCFRCAPGRSSAAPTTTNVTERCSGLPPSRSMPDG